MTKDFKKQAVSESVFGQYGMGWMAGGIAIGLLVGAGMYALAHKEDAPTTTALQPSADMSIAAADAGSGIQPAQSGGTSQMNTPATADEATTDEIPGFSYHAVLPQLEIDIPASVQAEQQAAAKQASSKADKKAENQPAPAVPTGFNGFQIGSYKTADQASDIQKRLKRSGLTTRVEQASVNGTVWFRVRLGPASSPDMMQKWQQTLSGMGISPMAVRM
ncbi:MAG: SPOR domain-containing protein [Thiothrix sp.]